MSDRRLEGATTETNGTAIKLQLRELSQLFNSMDPSPFHDRDLDRDAEEFIVGWAREIPHERPLELVIHLATPVPLERAAGVEEAVRHYFTVRATMRERDFRLLLHQGRVSLGIGLVFLASCLGLAEWIAHGNRLGWEGFVREGLTIAGWVAMWRPIQIYLYDWWPVRADVRVLERLAGMKVRLEVPAGGDRAEASARS